MKCWAKGVKSFAGNEYDGRMTSGSTIEIFAHGVEAVYGGLHKRPALALLWSFFVLLSCLLPEPSAVICPMRGAIRGLILLASLNCIPAEGLAETITPGRWIFNT